MTRFINLLTLFLRSFATPCPAVADIPFENIARHQILPQHSAATARLDGRGIRNCVRRHAGTVRAVALLEPVLSVGVRNSIPFCSEACRIVTCYCWRKVS